MFKIYGDYGYVSECLLRECETRTEAELWIDGYTRDGDLGGYNIIEAGCFEEDGKFVVFERVESMEDFYEADDDFVLIDEF